MLNTNKKAEHIETEPNVDNDYSIALKAKKGSYLRFYITREMDDFADFAFRFKGELLGLFKKMGADFQKAEDLLQDTFFRLFKNVDHLDPKKNEKPFIFTVARNIFYDDLRKQVALKRKGTTVFFSVLQNDTTTQREFDLTEDSEETPLNALITLEEIEIMQDYLCSMSSENTDLITEAFFCENTVIQSAENLGMSRETYRYRLRRLLNQIRTHLES